MLPRNHKGGTPRFRESLAGAPQASGAIINVQQKTAFR
jgi:hypothetical protein